MNPIRHPDSNVALGAPEKWDAEKNGPCKTLHVIRQDPYYFSYWLPDDAERALIAEGKPIRLQIHAIGHPPVMLTVEP